MIKRKIFLLIYIFLTVLTILYLSPKVYANTTTTTNSELSINQEDFGIEDFISEANKYAEDFFQDEDIGDIFNDAISGKTDNAKIFERILEVIGPEFLSTLQMITTILVIIIIHSILKSISESLENEGISKMIYYVQYILIVTVVMASFTDIIKMVEDTVIELVAFMNLLVPLLITLMLYTGSIVTSGMIQPILLFVINFVGNTIQFIILPLTLIFTALIIISKLSDQIQVEKLSKFLKSGIIWFFGIILTVFVTIVSLEGTLSSGVDGLTAKATKSIVSSAVPVVGKILGDVIDSVLGSGIILKNAVGFVGVIIVLGISIIPIIKLALLSFTYSVLGAIVEPIADEKITKLLGQVGDIFKILLAILSALSFLLIIGTALTLKISNTGMMYR